MLLETVKIIYVVTQACWSWSSHEVTHIKTPHDNLQCAVRMSGGEWAKDMHLRDTIRLSLHDPANLSFMGTQIGEHSPHAKKFAH